MELQPVFAAAGLNLAKNLGIIFLVVFYGATVLWTYKDARRRIEDPILIATAVATSMIPFMGVIVYMLLRPPEYIADVRERELEIRAMERTLGRQERCPYCKSHIESEFLSCPICATKLRQSCRRCDKPLDPRWKVCPYCETEAPRAASVDVPREGRGSRGGRGDSPAPRKGDSPRATRARSNGSKPRATSSRPRPASLDTEPLSPAPRRDATPKRDSDD